MNAQSFFEQSDYNDAKSKIDNREPFCISKDVKKQNIAFTGIIVNDQCAKTIWKGVNYLIGVDETNGTSGGGYATTDYSSFDTWESFLLLVDDTLGHREGYEKQNDSNIQTALF